MAPDSTAVRTALWRALHVQIDPPPHVFEDEIGLRLAAPDEGWRDRPDMHPQWTRAMRAAILARARFVEELVAHQVGRGVDQYVILSAGLDTFAQRRPELASRLRVFEVDRAGPQDWKRRRLIELGYGIPSFLQLVPVDFEAGPWIGRLSAAGCDRGRPAVVASTGVAMYLTRDAIRATLREIATLASASTLVMSFIVPVELMAPEDRRIFEWAKKDLGWAGRRRQASGLQPTAKFALPCAAAEVGVDGADECAKHHARSIGRIGHLEAQGMGYREDRNTVPGGKNTSRVALGEVTTGDTLDHVDSHGRHTHPEHVLVACELDLGQHGSGRAKGLECGAYANDVVWLVPHPEIDVLGESGTRVEADGVPTDDQVVNLVCGEDRQQIFEVRVEWHVP